MSLNSKEHVFVMKTLKTVSLKPSLTPKTDFSKL